MGLKKLAEKLGDYNERLEAGKARKIQPSHVEKVLGKLRKKEAELIEESERTKDKGKRKRLQQKIQIAQEQIERAEWLLGEIET